MEVQESLTVTLESDPLQCWAEESTASALREYRHGGRPQWLEDKLDRIIDDAEGILSKISDPDSSL